MKCLTWPPQSRGRPGTWRSGCTKRLVQATNKVRVSRILESGGLSSEHRLCQGAMEEGILNVELVSWPLAGESQREHRADCGRLDDETGGFGKVNARTLGETTKDPTSLVAFQRTIDVKLVLEDPLARDSVGMSGARNQVPSLVLEKRCMLFLHSSPPIGIDKGTMEGLQNRRQGRNMVHDWHAEAVLSSSHHAMMVDRGWDDDNTSGKRAGCWRRSRCCRGWRRSRSS
jgi:hypothetical protein